MSKRNAIGRLLSSLVLLPMAVGYLAFTHRAVTVSCQRMSGKVNCNETERIADQTFWTQPVWTATANDANLTTRTVDDVSNPGAVIIRTQGDTQQVQFTSGALGTNEAKVENELHQFFVVRKTDPSLQFELAPGTTWRDWLPPAILIVSAVGLLLFSLFRLVAPNQPRNKMR